MKKIVNYTHVGEILLDELIARNLTQIWLVKEAKIPKTIISDIINGKRSVNAKYALKLESALKIDAEFWLNAQSNYELAKLRSKKEVTMSNNKQTAVQWLEQEFIALQNYSVNELGLIEKAKEMEKKQIEDAYNKGEFNDGFVVVEDYYNEIYGK